MKSILITGASRGIGRALCVEAARRGIETHALVRKADQTPPGAIAHVGDLRDRAGIKALMKELAPRIDCYLANAGVGDTINPSEPDAADRAADLLEINGTATVHSMYALAYEWIQAGESSRGKRIAAVSSLVASLALPKTSVYSASKNVELMVCQGLAFDLKRNGIDVSVVQPGFIDTDMSAHVKDRPFLISAEQAASRILDGLSSGKARIAFPASTAGLVWFSNRVPKFLLRSAVRQMEKRGMM